MFVKESEGIIDLSYPQTFNFVLLLNTALLLGELVHVQKTLRQTKVGIFRPS